MLHRENKESDFTLEKKEPQSPGARSNHQNRHRDTDKKQSNRHLF